MAGNAEQPLAVVALSGGMDSCVTAAIAAETSALALLHVTYGQRAARRERQAFDQIAAFYGVPDERRLVADIDYLARIGGSSLTDPNEEISLSGDAAGVPSSYVPFRNTHILSIAVSWAEVIGAGSIYMGAVELDSSGYPDCRPAYFEAFAKVIEKGTRPETVIRVVTPVIGMSKAEIVARGVDLAAPLHLTWSCYRGEDAACGKCDSCRLRLRAFEAAGVPDPIPYAP
ncbi:MAG: 7-cyano-7-deazaguanine synthase QueC [Planctomycetota bacterium]